MTREEAYKEYWSVSQTLLHEKEVLKSLRQRGEREASQVKESTSGTLNEKIAAIRAAWEPFNVAIAQAEANIKASQARADELFAIWNRPEGGRATPRYHYCTLAWYGDTPTSGNIPSWDGELFSEWAARETVKMLEEDRKKHPEKVIQTPFGPCRAVSAYLCGPRVIWQLEEIEDDGP